MVSGSIIKKLKEAQLPQHEIANLIHNLDELEQTGGKPKKIEKFVNKLLKNSELKQKFISDYTIGYKEIGIKPP
ncbi:MAG: hypothetical protein ACTSQO_14920 [Candidatus Helarchaeota archaeon]